MGDGREFFVIDRFEEGVAMLESSSGATREIRRTELAIEAKEGDALRVEAADDGKTTHYRIDASLTARLRAEGSATLEILKKRDPGGDITL